MGWGTSSVQEARLRGGGQCPKCNKFTLCANGSLADFGHKIVNCHACGAILCAHCGQTAKSKEAPGGTKYFCTCAKT